MKAIGARAFSWCTRLRSVRLSEGLEILGAKEVAGGQEGNAFCATAIERIALPSTLRRIEAETFKSCWRLRSVEVPNGVEYIGTECFEGSRV